MRPHRLIMKAFGPFAQETVVDFDAMGNSIYLICGDTGAGKTTIFDGIIYALYGKASGEGRTGLGTEAFHSDYAKDGSRRGEMRVSLTFSNAGREFTAERRMYWGKKGDARLATKESVLYEGSSAVVYGKGREDRDDVTAKVTEILGLDADQFRRIIMLAQGEFQKFLTAKSDTRGEILGKLYDNRRHQDFQLRLKAAAALLKEQDSALAVEAKAQLNSFVVPEGSSEEERETLSADHPALLDTMRRMIEKMEDSSSELRTEIAGKEAVQKSLEARKTQGQTANSLLDDLDAKKTQLAQLDERQEQIEGLRRLVSLGKASEKVLPAETALRRAESEYNEVCGKIRGLEDRKSRLEVRAEELKSAAEETEAAGIPQIAELSGKASDIQSILHIYDDLAASRELCGRKDRALKEADEAVVTAQEALRTLRERQSGLAAELTRLESAGDQAVTIAQNRVGELTGRMTSLKEIRDSIGKVNELTAQEADLTVKLTAAQTAALTAETEHLRLNTAFLQGQAGVLAQDMRDRLQTAAEVVCPVCGAVHTAADAHLFAALHENIPTKEQVDEAYKAMETAHRAANDLEIERAAKANALSIEKQSLVTKAERLIPAAGWDALADGTAVSAAIGECEEQTAAAEQQLERAEDEKQAKEQAQTDKAKADEDVSAAETAVTEAVSRQSAARSEAAAAKAGADNWLQQLQGYPAERDDAQSAVDKLLEEAAVIQKQIDEAKAAHAGCLRELAEISGNLAGANSEKESRESAGQQAEKTFMDSLEANGFADTEAYRAAMSPEGVLLAADRLSRWIAGKDAEISGYEQSRRSLEAAITQLAESTKDMERADVAAIEEKIEAVSSELKEVRDREKTLSAYVQTDRNVYGRLTGIQERRGRNLRLMEELLPMADTADGKYAFSRYVLNGFFRRIVEQANVHLETMTDGEYCLVPKETGDGRSNMGLELKVLNTITNQERDTATLSGGQLFEASLSLALGLSDVVQMESTSTVQIDSMFIDEGFGSLDEGRLDKSIEVLQHLAAGRRQIGIISHVARLDECLPKKIHVIAGSRGSTVRIETDM